MLGAVRDVCFPLFCLTQEPLTDAPFDVELIYIPLVRQCHSW